MRVLFLVRVLGVGGAQRQLVAAARGLRRRGHDTAVAAFYEGGVFEQELRSDGIEVRSLGKQGRWDLPRPLARLVRLIRSTRPDVIYSFMSLANLSAALVKPLAGNVPLVWGVRSAMEDLRAYGWVSRTGPWLDRLAARLADGIIANSEAARAAAVRMGMDARKIAVVPNGFDCERFRPDPGGRIHQRRGWGLPADAPLVGMVARLDPVKNHACFLRAAARVAAVRGDVRFVIVGDGEPGYRRDLVRIAGELGLSGRVTWAGEARVTSAVYSAVDVAVLSSNVGESFPNVVGEAMACGTPCVVSESGDASLIVGDAGVVVPPGDDAALGAAALELLDRARSPGSTLGARARARIVEHYSQELLVRRTEAALERAVSRSGVRAGPERASASDRRRLG